jgi:RNA polymerase-binding transcription factor DksA
VTGPEDPRAALLAGREQTSRRLAGLERDFAGSVEAADMANADDEHDPEGATLAFERQQVASLIEQARDQLGQIDEALGRLAAGTYGLCCDCGRPIGAARLCGSCGYRQRTTLATLKPATPLPVTLLPLSSTNVYSR